MYASHRLFLLSYKFSRDLRILLAEAPFLKYKILILHKIWSPAVIREIKIREIEYKSPYTVLAPIVRMHNALRTDVHM